MEPLSLSEYARRRGVSAKAVSKAVASGRLRASVVKVGGQPKIANAELADQEWGANTRRRVDHPPPSSPSKREKKQKREVNIEPNEAGELPPSYETSRAWREAHAARREGAMADLAEIEVDERLEELVPAAEVRAFLDEKFALIKTRFLGIPSRVAQQLPEVAGQVAPIVERLIAEVLEELAAEVDGDDEDVE